MAAERPERSDLPASDEVPGGPWAGLVPMPPPGSFEYLIQCRYCGCVPAASVSYRGHRGLILIMQFRKIEGPFCRSCGLEAFRRMTSDTMIQGWWGAFSFFITPIILVRNAVLRHRVANLDPPRPPPHGPSRTPDGPGAPLFLRPAAIVPTVILLLLLLRAVFHI
jgi:hypothetical protein